MAFRMLKDFKRDLVRFNKRVAQYFLALGASYMHRTLS